MSLEARRFSPLGEHRLGDQNTGEIIDLHDDRAIIIMVHKRPKCKERFVRMWDDSLRAIGADKDLRGRPMAILVYIMGSLDFENYVAVTQSEIATELGIAPPNVSAAFRVLVDKGILQEGPRVGRMRSYRLNSHYGWKGSPISLTKRRREEDLAPVGKSNDQAQQLDFDGNEHPHQNPVS